MSAMPTLTLAEDGDDEWVTFANNDSHVWTDIHRNTKVVHVPARHDDVRPA
jgi:hypothetical protein